MTGLRGHAKFATHEGSKSLVAELQACATCMYSQAGEQLSWESDLRTVGIPQGAGLIAVGRLEQPWAAGMRIVVGIALQQAQESDSLAVYVFAGARSKAWLHRPLQSEGWYHLRAQQIMLSNVRISAALSSLTISAGIEAVWLELARQEEVSPARAPLLLSLCDENRHAVLTQVAASFKNAETNALDSSSEVVPSRPANRTRTAQVARTPGTTHPEG